MRDALGDTWDVQQDGRIGDGGNNIYDGGGKLFVGADNQEWASPQQTASFDPARNEVTLAPNPVDGLNVTRRLSVNARQNWCRWVEVLENPAPPPSTPPSTSTSTSAGRSPTARTSSTRRRPKSRSASPSSTATTTSP